MMTITIILNGLQPGTVTYFPYDIDKVIKLNFSYPITLVQLTCHQSLSEEICMCLKDNIALTGDFVLDL